LAEDSEWDIYFEKFPYVKNNKILAKSLEKVKLYKFIISWVRFIDNSKGFGNRLEFNL
jgi:uncharacterized protein YhbP (UPF0306 family)